MISLRGLSLALALAGAAIADISDVPRPRIGNAPYGVDITACSVPGTLALTFDDGPAEYTGELLNILAENDVAATFFVTGLNGDAGPIDDPSTGRPALLKRMLAEGHQIGSHSWSHQDADLIGPEEKRQEVILNEVAFTKLFGFFPTYYRPPYTHCNGECFAVLEQFGYHITNYNLDTKDWEVSVSQAKDNFAGLLGGFSPQSSGVIALAHDIHANTVRELTQFMIDKARAAGYNLVTVGECLGDPEVNWYRDSKTGGPVDESRLRNAGAKPTPSSSSSAPASTTTSSAQASSTSAEATSSLEESTAPTSSFAALPTETADGELPGPPENKGVETVGEQSAAARGVYPSLAFLLGMALWWM
ncbi:Chitin deacetylase [Scedosporium apiospermum]|uniref:Chitin deacetylase n=1 Tax=Pseudallescheria apiosperma TaxID=563466 RepID=A0A084FXK4_PSEDA|nr:Chitin deacetylase [Scedosporium apiospermum]KEZ39816.1 Chitin deacetylase [Scedosporium apiospermum]